MVRTLDLLSGGPGCKLSSLPLDGFVFGGPEFNSPALCKRPTGLLPTSWDFLQISVLFTIFVCLFTVSSISTVVLNTLELIATNNGFRAYQIIHLVRYNINKRCIKKEGRKHKQD